MKLTEKYYLCDMCSKLVEHLEDNKMAKFLYFTDAKVLTENISFENRIKYSKDFTISHLFEILKGTQEKYLCTKCRGNLYKRYLLMPFLIEFNSKKYPLSIDIVSETETIHLNTIEITGFRTNDRIEFAEAKNKKLAGVYFAPINIRIEEMLEEENDEQIKKEEKFIN